MSDPSGRCVSHPGAEQVCAFVGGRLCAEQEWLSACRGTEGRAFPYGQTFDLAACNVQSETVKVAGPTRGTAPVGSQAGCEGGLAGLFDMAGNVSEWVSDCKGAYCKFRGAGHLSNDPIERFAACQGACSGNQKTLQSSVVGVRCCRAEQTTPQSQSR